MATNKIAQDLKLVDNDLYFSPVTGDLVIHPSDNQHIEDILASEPGWWKLFPEVGAGLRRLLKGKVDVQSAMSVMKQQLEADGYQVTQPTIKKDGVGKYTIKPNAKRIKF